jgi:hypothetical protein
MDVDGKCGGGGGGGGVSRIKELWVLVISRASKNW